MKECEGVRELQRPHMQNVICCCIEAQKTVGGRGSRGVALKPSGSAVQCVGTVNK
jgi:hypothetical protein